MHGCTARHHTASFYIKHCYAMKCICRKHRALSSVIDWLSSHIHRFVIYTILLYLPFCYTCLFCICHQKRIAVTQFLILSFSRRHSNSTVYLTAANYSFFLQYLQRTFTYTVTRPLFEKGLFRFFSQMRMLY